MNSALYFPHTRVNSQSLLREALLLWDRVETIVPWEDQWVAADLPSPYVRAQEILVVPRVPSTVEKLGAHKAVEQLIAKGLPQWLLDAAEHPLNESYGVYGEKFLPETWKMLEEASLARVRQSGRRNYDVPRGVGLILLSSMATECAGKQHHRITDQAESYGCLNAWMAAQAGAAPEVGAPRSIDAERQRLVSMCISKVATDGIPIERLVELRFEEIKKPGTGYREFRANYRRRIEECLANLAASANSLGDYREILASFEDSMADDLANLRTELGLAKGKMIFNRDLVVGLTVAAGVFVPELPLALQATTAGIATLAGVASAYVDYLGATRKAMQGKAMSWLHVTSA